MNEELTQVYHWLTSNKLTLNLKKSNYVIFRPYQKKVSFTPKLFIRNASTNRNSQLECKDFVKYLGVLIDHKLSWNNHINTILLKISRTVGLLSKLRHFVPLNTLVSIYRSLIAPYIRYGLVAWGQTSKKQLNKLLILQKRVLHFIHFANPRDHAIPLFINTKILPVNFLYYQLLAEAMFDVSNNVVPTNIQELFLPLSRVHSYNTRSSKSQNFYVMKSNREIQKNSFSRIDAKLWNHLPTEIRTSPKQKFKSKIRSLLFDILETGDTYYDLDEITFEMKKRTF